MTKIVKYGESIDYNRLKAKTFSVSCLHCRTTACIAHIEKGVIEFKCRKCSKFTTVSFDFDY